MRFTTRALGWGIAIYATMYLLWSGLVIYGLSFGLFSLGVRVIALIVVTAIAARSLRLATRTDILPYSISWAVVAIILDAVFLVPFSGFGLYAQWSVWAGYALVALAPLLTFRFPRLGMSSGVEARKTPVSL